MTKLIPREIKAETKIYFFTLKSLVFMGIWVWLSIVLTSFVHKSLYLPFLVFEYFGRVRLTTPFKSTWKKDLSDDLSINHKRPAKISATRNNTGGGYW